MTDRQETTAHCPQCGEPTAMLCEGYCEPCREANQAALDEHNAALNSWDGLTDAQRSQNIREAVRWG